MVQEKSSIPRRQFLTQTSACVTAGLGCLAHGAGQLEAGTSIGARDMRKLSEADFRQTIGQVYRVTAEVEHGTPVAMELVLTKTSRETASARRRDTRPPHVRQHPFSVTFVSRSGLPLAQGTYLVEHATFGRFPLFLVPQGADGDQQGRQYLAVFG